MADKVSFYINHTLHQVKAAEALLPLSSYLRYEKSMTGTKVVCEEGDCGACTVMLGRIIDGKLQYEIIDSCIYFVFQLNGCHIITVEGLQTGEKLHQAQEAMINYFGSQCGFCTPGFVVAIADLAEKKETFNEQDIKDKLTGNLCRCTGYEPIIKACMALNDERSEKVTQQFDQSLILKNLQEVTGRNIELHIDFHDIQKKVFIPASLKKALQYKSENTSVRLLAGSTDVGVQFNKEKINPVEFMPIGHLRELANINRTEETIEIGAAATWSQISHELGTEFPELAGIIQVFASEQIKNVATMAGNIINGSPIADSLPFLYINNAVLTLTSVTGERKININDFYRGYKDLNLEDNEILTAITLNRQKANQVQKLYKVSKRKDLDISIFTAGIQLEVENNIIREARLAYGGVGPVILRLPETEKFLKGKQVSLEAFSEAGRIARKEVTPISDVRASQDYRYQLAENILQKFYWEIETRQVTAV